MIKNKVVVLGAGFSKPAGIPSQNELLNEVVHIDSASIGYQQASLLTNKELIETFIKLLYGDKYLKMIEDEKVLLEDIYTLIDANIIRQKNVGVFNVKSLYRIREALDDCISYVVNKGITSEDIDNYSIEMKRVVFSERAEVSFISTNWDYLLEKVLMKMSYEVDYAIDIEWTGREKKGKRKKTVLKPHGSLNWKMCPICETIYSSDEGEISGCTKCNSIHDRLTSQYSADIERLRSVIQVPQKVELQPIFVTPTFLKSSYSSQLNRITLKMYRLLSKAKEIIFIGYSLPISDHDIREILMRAHANSEDQKISVILKAKSAERDRLMKNYCTLYKLKKEDFNWRGFNA